MFDNDGNDHGYDNSDSNSNDLILKAVIGALEVTIPNMESDATTSNLGPSRQ
ncbi:1787_t:CDS:2 [Entrophospora sp. SA101]|nr:1787_t:CDS:2 [Entrophospora sp. SA101]